MRLTLCRMWNLSYAELDAQPAGLLRDTLVIWNYEEARPNG